MRYFNCWPEQEPPLCKCRCLRRTAQVPSWIETCSCQTRPFINAKMSVWCYACRSEEQKLQCRTAYVPLLTKRCTCYATSHGTKPAADPPETLPSAQKDMVLRNLLLKASKFCGGVGERPSGIDFQCSGRREHFAGDQFTYSTCIYASQHF